MGLCGRNICGCLYVIAPNPVAWITGSSPTVDITGFSPNLEVEINPNWTAKLAAETARNVAWTSYTPVVSQGVTTNIAKSVFFASYYRWGPNNKTCTFGINLTMTGAGTAGSIITVSLPVASQMGVNFSVGFGAVTDVSGPTRYPSSVELSGATQGEIVFTGDTSGNSQIGQQPSFALAAGDTLQAQGTYQIF